MPGINIFPTQYAAIPQYQIHHDKKKSGLLVLPSEVTVVGAVDNVQQEPSEQDVMHAHSSVGTSQGAFAVSHHISCAHAQ